MFDAYSLVMEQDGIGGFHLDTEFGNHFAVDTNHAGLDEFIGFATAANACIGQNTCSDVRGCRGP